MIEDELSLIHKLLVKHSYTCSVVRKKQQWHRYANDCVIVSNGGKEFLIHNEDDLWEFTKKQGNPLNLYPINTYINTNRYN